MKLFVLTLLLAVPTPLTFVAFVFLASFLYTHAVLKRLTSATNYRYQHARPTRPTNKYATRTYT